jgi:protein-disulfide isomerase
MNDSNSPADTREVRVTRIVEACTMLAVIAFAIVVILKSTMVFYGATLRQTDSAGKQTGFATIEPVMIDLGQSASTGAEEAPVGIVMFSDFECSFCSAFSLEVLPSLRSRYVDSGRVRLTFKHFPLVSIHPEARRVAELATCVNDHKTFWKAHDLLFQRSRTLATITSSNLATALDIDPAALAACAAQRGRDLVDADTRQAMTLGLRGTPTFFIGEIKGNALRAFRRLEGANPFHAFEAALANITRDRR